MMEQANKFHKVIDRIAKDIFQPFPRCDPCCSCRQTKAYFKKIHSTKQPHLIINSLINEEENTYAIGDTVLHSETSSVSSICELPYVPSSDKLIKNQLISGISIEDDGTSVKQAGGIIKTLEHKPREILLSKRNNKIKNVPPCGCSNEEEEKNDFIDDKTKNKESLCFGRKFRPDHGVAYSCQEFGIENNVSKRCKSFEEESFTNECGCNFNSEKCNINENKEQEILRSNIEEELKENNILEIQKTSNSIEKKQNFLKMCGKCWNKSNKKKNIKEIDSSKINDSEINKENTSPECSCDDLLEFLQIDIRKKYYTQPRKKSHVKRLKRKIHAANAKEEIEFNQLVQNKKKIFIESSDRKLKEELEVNKINLKNNVSKTTIDEEISANKIQKSEIHNFESKLKEELLNRTIVYLTDQSPPDYPAEQIPVREGGRFCQCRENRNKQKILLYNIGALTDNSNFDSEWQQQQQQQKGLQQVIEGIEWITPEPSIRISDEYIPEYELQNSLNNKQICCFKTINGTKNGREENNSANKLKVMKPVCECYYKRSLVRMNELKKKYHSQIQQHDSFPHISKSSSISIKEKIEMNLPNLMNDKVEIESPHITQFSNNNNFSESICYQNKELEKINTIVEVTSEFDKMQKKSENEIINLVSKNNVFQMHESKRNSQKNHLEKNGTKRRENSNKIIGNKIDRRSIIFDQLEEDLKSKIHHELEKLANEDFVSVKFPDYHKMPELLYWIIYRISGKHSTEEYKSKYCKTVDWNKMINLILK